MDKGIESKLNKFSFFFVLFFIMRLFNKYLESFVFIILFERNIFFLLLFRYFCTKDLGFPKEGFEQDKLIEAFQLMKEDLFILTLTMKMMMESEYIK